MRSSTTPPDSSQHRVYWAEPVAMRRTSLVRQRLTKSAAPGPVTDALPRWLTSKTPTRSRTAVCSATTPPPGYSIGMSQPPKSAILAPRATWRSCRGEVSGVVPDIAVVMGVNLPPAGYAACARYHRTPPPAAASWDRPEHHSHGPARPRRTQAHPRPTCRSKRPPLGRARGSCAPKHLDKGVLRGQPHHLEPFGRRHPRRRARRHARRGRGRRRARAEPRPAPQDGLAPVLGPRRT